MILKIGTASLKIKTYNNKELGLDNSYEDISFNLYQKFFFILFIPVLPMDKFWKVKNRKTNEFITTNAELRTKLNIIALKKKNPLWTYLGTIIVLAPFIYFLGLLIFNLGNDQLKKLESKKEKEIIHLQILNKIKAPMLNDLYFIKMIEMDPKKNINGKIIGYEKGSRENFEYQVTQFSNDTIKLKLTKYPKYYKYGLKIKNEVTTTKEQLTNITSKYNSIDFYETGTKSNPDLGAVFTIKDITRQTK